MVKLVNASSVPVSPGTVSPRALGPAGSELLTVKLPESCHFGPSLCCYLGDSFGFSPLGIFYFPDSVLSSFFVYSFTLVKILVCACVCVCDTYIHIPPSRI